ncbi:MAG: hypothetical protein IRZ08_02100, partial [Frankia sp.]|nr:hypothetical protein [Frankia sp.]
PRGGAGGPPARAPPPGPGDAVVVAGKGHETGQERNGVVTPFDDRDALAGAIRARVGGPDGQPGEGPVVRP